MKKTTWIFGVPLIFFQFFFSALTYAQHEHETSSMKSTFGYADSVNSGLILNDNLRGSPHRNAMASVGKNHIHIEYGSPGVKGRIIWGGLVPYDQVWAAGAHNVTTINFYRDIEINNKKIKKGSYGFFIIPASGTKPWTVILNKNYTQHLADEYDAKEDVLRMEITPEWSEKTIQRLTYVVQKKDEKQGAVLFLWDKLILRMPFTVD